MKNLSLPKPKPYNPNLNLPKYNSSNINNELHTPNQLPDPFYCDNIDKSYEMHNTIENNRKITLGTFDYESWNSTEDILDNFDKIVRQYDNIKQNSIKQKNPKISKEDEDLLNNFINSHTNSKEIQ